MISAYKYDANIRKATAYLQRNVARFDADTIGTLKLFKQVYGITFEVEKKQRDLLQQARPKQRVWLVDTNERSQMVSELEIRALRDWPWVLASASYCDLYPLTWDFLPKFRSLTESNTAYAVTRGLYAIALIEIKHCRRDIVEFEKERARLINEIPEIVQSSASGSFFWIDSVFILHFLGLHDWVTHDILSELAASQRPDGSWSGNNHATARALWLLVEAKENRLPGLLKENARKKPD